MAYERSMPATGSTFTTIPTNAPVFTADNERLGTVREVRADRFKVDVSLQPDYWLPLSSVTSAGTAGVMLGFVKDRLDDYKLKDGDRA